MNEEAKYKTHKLEEEKTFQMQYWELLAVEWLRAIAGNNVHYVHISNGRKSNCTRVWLDDVGGKVNSTAI